MGGWIFIFVVGCHCEEAYLFMPTKSFGKLRTVSLSNCNL